MTEANEPLPEGHELSPAGLEPAPRVLEPAPDGSSSTSPMPPEPTPDSGAAGRAGGSTRRFGRIGGSRADRNIVVFGLGMLLCAILIAFVPDFTPAGAGPPGEGAHGTIAALGPTTDVVGPHAMVVLLDGNRRGDTVDATLESPTGAAEIPDYRLGDEVLVSVDTASDGTVSFSVVDRWRLPVLGWLLGAFALVTIALAGWAGLRTLTSLAITLTVVIRLLIPLLLAGFDPLGLAIGLGIVITLISLLLTQGVSRATGAAIVGTTLSLLLSGGLSLAVVAAARFGPGQGSEDVVALGQVLGGATDLSGLLLAAVILGGLGVVADVAVTQALNVEAIRSLDPTLSAPRLFARASSGGIAHLSLSLNALVFAYLGSALPIVVLAALQVHRLDLAVNDEHVAVAIVRTVVGALGVLSAVPLTTAVAAWWVVRSRHARRASPRRAMASPLAAPPTDSARRAAPDADSDVTDVTERPRSARGRMKAPGKDAPSTKARERAEAESPAKARPPKQGPPKASPPNESPPPRPAGRPRARRSPRTPPPDA